jgi:hypothetical protein
MEDVRLLFRNFSGKPGKFNRNGDRTFTVVLDPGVAQAMAEDGWYVKWLPPREEDEGPTPILDVRVAYIWDKPKVNLVTSRGMTELGEDEIEMLDTVDIVKVDLTLRPRRWAVDGNSGVKAYLKSIYVTIDEDELEHKYARRFDSA